MDAFDYWKECVSEAAESCGVELTEEQVIHIAASVEGCHENFGMAFYSPPPSDRLAVIEQEAQAKYDRLEREFEAYRDNANTAIRKALRQHPDAVVSVEEGGEVYRHGGRTERIQ